MTDLESAVVVSMDNGYTFSLYANKRVCVCVCVLARSSPGLQARGGRGEAFFFCTVLSGLALFFSFFLFIFFYFTLLSKD